MTHLGAAPKSSTLGAITVWLFASLAVKAEQAAALSTTTQVVAVTTVNLAILTGPSGAARVCCTFMIELHRHQRALTVGLFAPVMRMEKLRIVVSVGRATPNA